VPRQNPEERGTCRDIQCGPSAKGSIRSTLLVHLMFARVESPAGTVGGGGLVGGIQGVAAGNAYGVIPGGAIGIAHGVAAGVAYPIGGPQPPNPGGPPGSGCWNVL